MDVTSSLSSWIASVSDYSVVSFGTGACDRIEGTLEFSGRKGLDFEGNGSTFRSFNAPMDTRAMWRAWQSSGLIFRNMTVTGSYASGGTFTSSLQHAHGIDLRGTGAEIADVTIDNVAGDCIYFGLGSDNTTRSSGSFRDSRCSGTSRNGVSVTAGNNILVQHDMLSAIGYDVFDVEPNTTAGNWGSSGVTFDSNTIGSYSLSAYSVVENAPISSQAFTNNSVTGRGLKITVGGNTVARPHGVTVTGHASDTPQAPSAMNLEAIDGLTVTGNYVPMPSGTMASVSSSCNVNIFNNSYPGGTSQYSITAYFLQRGVDGAAAGHDHKPYVRDVLSGTRTTIAAYAGSTAVKMAVYVDGSLLASSSSSTISATWNLRKVASGSHTITVDAWDASGQKGSSSATVYK